MTINEYQNLAMRTVNPDLDKDQMLINAVMGLLTTWLFALTKI